MVNYNRTKYEFVKQVTEVSISIVDISDVISALINDERFTTPRQRDSFEAPLDNLFKALRQIDEIVIATLNTNEEV